MKIRHFPAAVIVTATLTFWLSSTWPAAAQGPTFGPVPPPSNPFPATEQVQLSSGAQEVLKLTRAKVNDDVTVAFIQSSDRRINLTASEILYLRKEGVSDRVLTAMLSPQSQPASSSPPPPPPTAAADASFANAPQYINPPATTFVETVPASTVYLATTPSYYSFYDPWPYYYWPSWYYPAFSLGFYWGWGWGGCGYWGYPSYCHNGNWNNNYCYNGYNGYNNYNGNPSSTAYGNRPPAPGGSANSASVNGRTGGQGTLAADGRQMRGASQSSAPAPAASGASRIESRPANARPTSYWSNNGNQSTTARSSSSQANVANNSQATRPSPGGSGVNTRTATGRPNASPTSVWSGNSRQESARATPNRSATSAARPSPVSSAPTAVGSRSINQSANSYSTRPTMNYQRSSSVSPGYNYRSTGSAPSSRPSMSSSFSRPSMSSSSSSMRSAGAYRGGGSSFSSGGARIASGGGSRGGGGGGRSR